ncbi:TIGR03943 family protein [Nocardioidaceae bacterium]|nr:TIGR03943 family protein [Nocardioidaceae bacterium]
MAAVRAATQGLLIAMLGAVLVRISLTGEYLRFVTDWMRWPLLITGVLLLVMAAGPILRPERHEGDGGEEHDHAHPVPLVTWLLALPVIVLFVVPPPALGAFVAERRASDATPVLQPAPLSALPEDQVSRMSLGEFLYRASRGQGGSLEGVDVRLTGFVSYGEGGEWYLTRLTIGCCAADAAPYRVRVEGSAAPPRDQWVTATGRLVPGTGSRSSTTPASLEISGLREIPEPASPYE